MTFWLVQALNGISYGMLLFLLASGLSLIFGVMKILNLTHGSFYLLGGYFGLVVLQETGSFILAVLGASLAVALIGVIIERVFLRRFHLQQLPQVLITFGFLFIFSDIATVIWGANPQTAAAGLSCFSAHLDSPLLLSDIPSLHHWVRTIRRGVPLVASGWYPARCDASR